MAAKDKILISLELVMWDIPQNERFPQSERQKRKNRQQERLETNTDTWKEEEAKEEKKQEENDNNSLSLYHFKKQLS